MVLLMTLAWLFLLSFVRTWLRIRVDEITALFLAGCCVAYLLLPLVHYMLAADGYFYVTSSDNFFARGFGFQLRAGLVTAIVSWSILRLRVALGTRRKTEEP